MEGLLYLTHFTSPVGAQAIIQQEAILPKVERGTGHALKGSQDVIFMSLICESDFDLLGRNKAPISEYMDFFSGGEDISSDVLLLFNPELLNDRSDWRYNPYWHGGIVQDSLSKLDFDLLEEQGCIASEVMFPGGLRFNPEDLFMVVTPLDLNLGVSTITPNQFLQRMVDDFGLIPEEPDFSFKLAQLLPRLRTPAKISDWLKVNRVVTLNPALMTAAIQGLPLNIVQFLVEKGATDFGTAGRYSANPSTKNYLESLL